MLAVVHFYCVKRWIGNWINKDSSCHTVQINFSKSVMKWITERERKWTRTRQSSLELIFDGVPWRGVGGVAFVDTSICRWQSRLATTCCGSELCANLPHLAWRDFIAPHFIHIYRCWQRSQTRNLKSVAAAATSCVGADLWRDRKWNMSAKQIVRLRVWAPGEVA